jgi:hypothetical protein
VAGGFINQNYIVNACHRFSWLSCVDVSIHMNLSFQSRRSWWVSAVEQLCC